MRQRWHVPQDCRCECLPDLSLHLACRATAPCSMGQRLAGRVSSSGGLAVVAKDRIAHIAIFARRVRRRCGGSPGQGCRRTAAATTCTRRLRMSVLQWNPAATQASIESSSFRQLRMPAPRLGPALRTTRSIFRSTSSKRPTVRTSEISAWSCRHPRSRSQTRCCMRWEFACRARGCGSPQGARGRSASSAICAQKARSRTERRASMPSGAALGGVLSSRPHMTEQAVSRAQFEVFMRWHLFRRPALQDKLISSLQSEVLFCARFCLDLRPCCCIIARWDNIRNCLSSLACQVGTYSPCDSCSPSWECALRTADATCYF